MASSRWLGTVRSKPGAQCVRAPPAGSRCPVHAGCLRCARARPPRSAPRRNWASPVQLSPAMPLQKAHGVAFTIDLLRQAPPDGVTWCALGPLTNVATALVQAPDIIAGAKELVLMGGASRALGNTSTAAEFNILADPHAASIVFDSGLPITMMPLDLTHQVRSTPTVSPASARLTPVATWSRRCRAGPGRGRRRCTTPSSPICWRRLFAGAGSMSRSRRTARSRWARRWSIGAAQRTRCRRHRAAHG